MLLIFQSIRTIIQLISEEIISDESDIGDTNSTSTDNINSKDNNKTIIKNEVKLESMFTPTPPGNQPNTIDPSVTTDPPYSADPPWEDELSDFSEEEFDSVIFKGGKRYVNPKLFEKIENEKVACVPRDIDGIKKYTVKIEKNLDNCNY